MHLLCLLLVLLLHLLHSFWSSSLLRQLLMFLVLLLLEFLAILVLLRDHLFLLLLVFLVQLRVPRVGSGALDGRQFLRMDCHVGAGVAVTGGAPRLAEIRCCGLLCADHAC